MAVEFTPTSFSINIECHSNPTEQWLLLHQQLLEILRSIDPNNAITNSDYYMVLVLIQALMPDFDLAQKLKVN